MENEPLLSPFHVELSCRNASWHVPLHLLYDIPSLTMPTTDEQARMLRSYYDCLQNSDVPSSSRAPGNTMKIEGSLISLDSNRNLHKLTLNFL